MQLQHGNSWSGENVAGWFMAEKLDGWRAVWTGAELLTRSGNAYTAPDWFTRDLPPTPLDCELWLGRGFNCNDVHRAVAAGEWHGLKLVAFDVPQVGLSIEAALAALRSLQLPAHVAPVEYTRAESTEQAFQVMRETVAERGEGLMLRKPRTSYQPFRTSDLLKLKP